MTLHDFWVGGTAIRIAVFGVGLFYCVQRRGDLGVAMTHAGSIAVLVLLTVSREWATIVGVPVTILVVERLTRLVTLQLSEKRWRSLAADQHAINEHLVAELRRR